MIKYRRSVKKLVEPFRLPPEENFERIGPIVAKTEKGGAFLLRRKKNGKFFVWYGGVMCACDQSEAFAFAARQGKLSEKELFEGYSFFVLRDLSRYGPSGPICCTRAEAETMMREWYPDGNAPKFFDLWRPAEAEDIEKYWVRE